MRRQVVLLDLDGTLYASGQAIPGAAEAIGSLRKADLRLRFFTNTDSKTVDQVLAGLDSYRLGVAGEELFTPVVAATQYLAASAGAKVLALVSSALSETFERFAAGDGAHTHVLVGDCRDRLDYRALDAAFRAVRSGAELLAMQRGRYFKAADGDHLDTGAIVAALEYATGRTARVLGKPSPDFLALAAASAGAAADEVVVVGDDATTDIAMARAAGALAIQVRTGKFSDQAGEGLTSHADYVLDSVADLPELLSGLG
jgi:HAD superfamily hydrolase (TIGR01458 family)